MRAGALRRPRLSSCRRLGAERWLGRSPNKTIAADLGVATTTVAAWVPKRGGVVTLTAASRAGPARSSR
jgi:hypothetical protein